MMREVVSTNGAISYLKLRSSLWNVAITLALIFPIIALSSCDDSEEPPPPATRLQLAIARVGTYKLDLSDPSKNTGAPSGSPIVAMFSAPLDRAMVPGSITLKIKSSGDIVPLDFAYLDDDKTFSASAQALQTNQTYVLSISGDLRGTSGEVFPGHTIEFKTVPGKITITSLELSDTEVLTIPRPVNVPLEGTTIEIMFSAPLDPSTAVTQNFSVTRGGSSVASTIALSDNNKKVTLTITPKLLDLGKYQLYVSDKLRGAQEETFDSFAKLFYTAIDDAPDFPVISDEELLSLVQKQTFKYFWDFAHPASGMARERNTSGDLVTSGGSGFGIMALIVGMERNFITRAEGLQRMDKILDFLETADRFHGAWSHWINGNTGKVIPFGANDNGGDLVETAFLVEGLITFRQYLDAAVPAEQELINRINTLWQGVEWDWYRRSSQNVLYWHWSPNLDWVMNHQIKGWNECLITYVLAASSTTHTIPEAVYNTGWASNGSMKNGNAYEGITLPLGPAYGGPLFFAHYSFLGLDPTNLSDPYANYFTQNENHSLINYKYCVRNPKNFVGYSDECWGLTASDNHVGYNAHSPTNDLGVITPTAALSSFPYTPDESMKALKFFYYKMGDRLWGEYGFYDAFNITEGWTASSYLAIDQGPIIVMIENYRTGLLWDLFMSAPEIQGGLTKLGFTY